MRNQNLFNSLQDTSNFIGLESDMDEIINAIQKDNQMKTTTVPTEWFEDLHDINKKLGAIPVLDGEDGRTLVRIHTHIKASKYFTEQPQPTTSENVELEEFAKW